MKTPLTRLIITIAAIIVIFWLIGLALKITAWLLNLLLPAAALILIIALVYRFISQKPAATTSKKAPLKIEREPSKEK